MSGALGSVLFAHFDVAIVPSCAYRSAFPCGGVLPSRATQGLLGSSELSVGDRVLVGGSSQASSKEASVALAPGPPMGSVVACVSVVRHGAGVLAPTMGVGPHQEGSI